MQTRNDKVALRSGREALIYLPGKMTGRAGWNPDMEHKNNPIDQASEKFNRANQQIGWNHDKCIQYATCWHPQTDCTAYYYYSELGLSRYQNFKLRYNTSIKKKRYSIPLSIPRQKEKILGTQNRFIFIFINNLNRVLVQKKSLNTFQHICNNVKEC